MRLRLPSRPGMPCQELVETITDYLEDALPRERRRAFEAHLSDCPHCREYVAQFEATIEIAGRAPDAEELPAAQREALLTAFDGWSDAS